MIHFSPSTRGFYDSDFHASMPEDCVEVSDAAYAALFAGQAAGKIIIAGADGSPTLSDPPGLTTDQAWIELRARRDRLLTACDWTQLSDVPLAAGTKTAWEAYRQALRDLPENLSDPANVVWPVPPA